MILLRPWSSYRTPCPSRWLPLSAISDIFRRNVLGTARPFSRQQFRSSKGKFGSFTCCEILKISNCCFVLERGMLSSTGPADSFFWANDATGYTLVEPRHGWVPLRKAFAPTRKKKLDRFLPFFDRNDYVIKTRPILSILNSPIPNPQYLFGCSTPGLWFGIFRLVFQTLILIFSQRRIVNPTVHAQKLPYPDRSVRTCGKKNRKQPCVASSFED